MIQVNLVGPSSSYQTNFYSLSRKTHYRTVSIEKNSINSVILNENPHFKHQRMMVAGIVAINTSGTHILLKDTSILPDIPGLPGLVMMLFTPAMELRTNEERSYYTGALCGLGFNSLTKEPILPENDIELAFDVKFDVMDIIEINALRMAINSLLCNGPSSTLHLTPERICQLQDDCRDGLTRLFIRSPPREAVAPTNHENYGKWDQVDPSLRMDIAERGSGQARGVLFQLHSPILLNR
ncbi:putative ATP-dependent RNA helicase TDRD9 [Poecilia formosa]|uniref:putative ATP-dependent RNA helicase TDRD9 n=1 Tax=Poecilia formosa TaxID=48698 RepID=UPI0004442C47|nr:PREDICTED: putative ATP-dependent RNA helicase TDRD9 [Poecilia formosa]